MKFRYPIYKRMYEAKKPVCMYLGIGRPWYCKACTRMFKKLTNQQTNG